MGSVILTFWFFPPPCLVRAALKCWLCVDRFTLTVTCILFVALLPAACLIDNCTLLIPDSLFTSIVVFSFQKCLAAIPFTWGKKASWLTQTEQKLSFLLCTTFVWEKCKKLKKPGGIWGSLIYFCCWEDSHHLSFPSQSSVSDALIFFVASFSVTGWSG